MHNLMFEMQEKVDEVEGQTVVLGEEVHVLQGRALLAGSATPDPAPALTASLSADSPVEVALKCVKRLSDTEIKQHSKYLRAEAYADVGCLRESMQHKEEWEAISLPLRVKSELARAVAAAAVITDR